MGEPPRSKGNLVNGSGSFHGESQWRHLHSARHGRRRRDEQSARQRAGSWTPYNTNVTVTSLYIGRGAAGTLTQQGGTFDVSSNVILGYDKPGDYVLNSNGNLAVGHDLIVGDASGGSVDLKYGFVSVANNLIIGSDATGSYSQSDQTSVNGNVYLGEFPDGMGTLYIKGSTMYAGDADADTVYVGKGGSGKVSHTAGTFQASGKIYIADAATSISEYTIEDDPGVTGTPASAVR